MAMAARKRKQMASKSSAPSKKQKLNNQKNTTSKSQTSKTRVSAAKTKQNKAKQQQKRKQKQPQQPEEEEPVELHDEDVDFFKENAQFASFLTSIDANALSKPVVLKQKQPKLLIEKAVEEAESKPRKGAWVKADALSEKLPVKSLDGTVRVNKLLREQQEEAKAEAKAKEQEEDEDEEQQQQDEEGEDEDEDEAMDSDVSEMEFEEITEVARHGKGANQHDSVAAAVSEKDLKLLRERRVASKKLEIATLCETIMESPEEALRKSKDHAQELSKFQQLHALCEDSDVTVRKLAMLSELAVLLDILPDYRIRIEHAKDPKGDHKSSHRPLKKKVQQMQDYEASMLKNYQLFLKFCAHAVQKGLPRKSTKGDASNNNNSESCMLANLTIRQQMDLSVAKTALKCLCELLQSKYNFNFHRNLIVALVPLSDCMVHEFRTMVCQAFGHVFGHDKSFACSLEIVQQMAGFVKKKEHKVHQDMIHVLTQMPLDVTMEEGEHARKQAKRDRKRRRNLQKDGDKIASGLKEAEAVVDVSERNKHQADILHEIVLIYFRVLKHNGFSKSLPAVLQGLTKFGFLINFDIMNDLLQVLKGLLQDETNGLPLHCAFQAVLTGLRTFHSGRSVEQELMIDEKEFVDILYRLLRQFCEQVVAAWSYASISESGSPDSALNVSSSSSSCLVTALSCVEAVFLKRKEIVVERVAAFVKRLLMLSLWLPPHQTLSVLSIVRSLFHRYSKLHQLLENDQDRIASGVYRAEIDDPDFSTPFSSACWELALLSRHMHPKVAQFAHDTATLGSLLPNEHFKPILDAFDCDKLERFHPKVPKPMANPLHTKLQKMHQQMQRKRNRNRLRPVFVQQSPFDASTASLFLRQCLQVDQEPLELDTK